MTEKELIQNACRPFDEVWFEVGYRIKVIELSNNRKAKREFTNREMAFNCFNPRLVKEYLSSEEYSNLLKVLEYYSDDKAFSFNYKEWREHIVQIIASYDLVAPYYKFGTIKTDESLEKLKLKFRERAREIIAGYNLLVEEWEKLLLQFSKEFSKGYKFN